MYRKRKRTTYNRDHINISFVSIILFIHFSFLLSHSARGISTLSSFTLIFIHKMETDIFVCFCFCTLTSPKEFFFFFALFYLLLDNICFYICLTINLFSYCIKFDWNLEILIIFYFCIPFSNLDKTIYYNWQLFIIFICILYLLSMTLKIAEWIVANIILFSCFFHLFLLKI